MVDVTIQQVPSRIPSDVPWARRRQLARALAAVAVLALAGPVRAKGDTLKLKRAGVEGFRVALPPASTPTPDVGGDPFSDLAHTPARVAGPLAGATVHDASGNPFSVIPGGQTWVKGDVLYVRETDAHRLAIDPHQTRYARLAAHFAPVWLQDIDDTRPEADLILAVDFDGDFRTADAWENLLRPRQGPVRTLRDAAVVYWWVVETRTHLFVGYADYHPRDWEDSENVKTWVKNHLVDPIRSRLGKGSGEHENDMEGMLLMLRKRPGGAPVPELMLTQAHNNYFQYGDPRVFVPRYDGKKRREDIDGPIVLQDGRPVVYVQAKGHGVYGHHKGKTDFDGKKGDGIIYRYSRSGLSAGRGEADYSLQPLSVLWRLYSGLTSGQSNQTFTRGGGGVAFVGDTRDDDSANPPWGWSDEDYPSSVNAWFFDEPARLVAWMFADRRGSWIDTTVIGRSWR